MKKVTKEVFIAEDGSEHPTAEACLRAEAEPTLFRIFENRDQTEIPKSPMLWILENAAGIVAALQPLAMINKEVPKPTNCSRNRDDYEASCGYGFSRITAYGKTEQIATDRAIKAWLAVGDPV